MVLIFVTNKGFETYLVIFDFYHDKFLNVFLITMQYFFFNSTMVHRSFFKMYPFDVCTGWTFVLVRRFSQSDICTSLTFLSPMFVLSDVCTVRSVFRPTFELVWYRIVYTYTLYINKCILFIHIIIVLKYPLWGGGIRA